MNRFFLYHCGNHEYQEQDEPKKNEYFYYSQER
jgi:hypothetical protein